MGNDACTEEVQRRRQYLKNMTASKICTVLVETVVVIPALVLIKRRRMVKVGDPLSSRRRRLTSGRSANWAEICILMRLALLMRVESTHAQIRTTAERPDPVPLDSVQTEAEEARG